jgi:hypothetical protein
LLCFTEVENAKRLIYFIFDPVFDSELLIEHDKIKKFIKNFEQRNE